MTHILITVGRKLAPIAIIAGVLGLTALACYEPMEAHIAQKWPQLVTEKPADRWGDSDPPVAVAP